MFKRHGMTNNYINSFAKFNLCENFTDLQMFPDADIAFAGCGFNGMYYVGVSKRIDSLAPQILQRRIGGASAGKVPGSEIQLHDQCSEPRCPPGRDFDG